MLEEILQYLNNYFYEFKEIGQYSIVDNKIKVKGKYYTGQYIRIIDSTMNDGVYKIKIAADGVIELEETLINEEFAGCICALKIPKKIITLEGKISEFQSKYKPNMYSSEHFANYSYTMATDNSGRTATWATVFYRDLKPYRKMFDNLGYVKEVR